MNWPASLSCTVEATVRSLEKRGTGSGTVGPIEAVKRGQDASGGNLENRAIIAGSAALGCPVEVSVRALHQRCRGKIAVGSTEAI